MPRHKLAQRLVETALRPQSSTAAAASSAASSTSAARVRPAGASAPHVLVLLAPPAANVHEVAQQVARRLPGELINASFLAAYTHTPIAAASSRSAAAGMPHHLLGVRHPLEPLQPQALSRSLRSLCRQVHAHGRTPIICGGSAGYLQRFMAECSAPAGSDRLKEHAPHKSRAALLVEQMSGDWDEAVKVLEILNGRDLHTLATGDWTTFESHLERALQDAAPDADEAGGADEEGSSTPMKFTLVGISQPKEILLQSSDRMLELQLHSGLLQEALDLMSMDVERLSPVLTFSPHYAPAIAYFQSYWLTNAFKNKNAIRNRFWQYLRRAQHAQRQSNSQILKTLFDLRPTSWLTRDDVTSTEDLASAVIDIYQSGGARDTSDAMLKAMTLPERLIPPLSNTLFGSNEPVDELMTSVVQGVGELAELTGLRLRWLEEQKMIYEDEERRLRRQLGAPQGRRAKRRYNRETATMRSQDIGRS